MSCIPGGAVLRFGLLGYGFEMQSVWRFWVVPRFSACQESHECGHHCGKAALQGRVSHL